MREPWRGGAGAGLVTSGPFADHKEKVVDLLMRVTRVSVETVAITDAMRNMTRPATA